MRAVTGINIALWDLAGKILNVPAATLLGGSVRNRMRMYTGTGPRNMLDKASCREWADQMKTSKAGWLGFKLGGPRGGDGENAADGSPREISNKELIDIRQGFENCREAIGWDRDLMYHGMWSFNLPSSIRLAEALEPAKVAWLEDPMPPNFSDAWVHLTAVSKTPILTGENLGRHQEWADFFFKKGIHIGQLDMRNVGGLNEAKKISDLADLALIPMCAHNTGCIVNNFATLQWACTVRDFKASETRIGNGDWMDDVILHDGPVVKNGHIDLPDKPGLGIELNPDIVKAHLAKDETYWG
jgi:L-alanine-DL-glutamate epimerase-like enolase superfamily enzyme